MLRAYVAWTTCCVPFGESVDNPFVQFRQTLVAARHHPPVEPTDDARGCATCAAIIGPTGIVEGKFRLATISDRLVQADLKFTELKLALGARTDFRDRVQAVSLMANIAL